MFDHLTGRWDQAPAVPRRPARRKAAPEQWTLSGLRLEAGPEDYARNALQALRYIERGEAYQVNFTTRYRFELDGSPLGLYRALRQAQPVPYAGMLRDGDRWVLSCSPELFFRLEPDGAITTRPMKGTLRRGRYLAEDRALAARLRRDPKNRAENLMIVDLLRNDLGRVCRTGSVRVPRLFTVEPYPTLFQLTSTVEGKLAAGQGMAAVLRALFPSGSVTGAPKISAMRIIRELEDAPRGIYTGSLGFFAPDGRAVFNVAIRTLEIRAARGLMGVGGGLVADSTPAAEYAECRLKGRFLTSGRPLPANPELSLIETMLCVDDEIRLLELHLKRLRESARFFGYPCRLKSIRAGLADAAAGLAGRHKLRLRLDPDGRLSLESSTVEPVAGPVRVALYPEPVDSGDLLLYHKTTCRPLQTRALAAARSRGLFDCLLRNQDGQLTEGAICNLYLERRGVLFTPPRRCGLLAGVFRQHLKQRQDPPVRERVLDPGDLASCDRLWISNAVRGLVQAELVD